MLLARKVVRLRRTAGSASTSCPRSRCCPVNCPADAKTLASAGFNWLLPAEMTDSALEAALFAPWM
jgi:hypothetical protein